MYNDLRKNINVNTEFNDWRDSIRLRIKTANDTSNRARYTLIFLSLVSAGFIMAIFSYFYSWNKEFAFKYLENPTSANIVRDGIIREWLTTQTYQLPILGIKIMASDIQIFGPLVLLIVSTWNYYEVRREHYTIGRLIGDVYYVLYDSIKLKESKAIILCQEVYHNLIGYTVFNVIPYDSPINNLGDPLISGTKVRKITFNIKLRRGIIKFLVFTPLLSISFIALTRILTFFIIRSPVTGKLHPPLADLSDLRTTLLFSASILILLSSYVCFINMTRVFKLDNSTRNLLDEYQIWAFQSENNNENSNKVAEES